MLGVYNYSADRYQKIAQHQVDNDLEQLKQR
jgi:hypothetical protein